MVWQFATSLDAAFYRSAPGPEVMALLKDLLFCDMGVSFPSSSSTVQPSPTPLSGWSGAFLLLLSEVLAFLLLLLTEGSN